MTTCRFALVACLTLVPLSCSGNGTPGGNAPDDREVEESSDLGQSSGGSGDARYAIKCSYWRKGDHMVVCGVSEYPNRPQGPAFLLLLKLTSRGGGFGSANSVSSDGEQTGWSHGFRGAADRTHTVAYQIKHNPLGERFTLEDHEVPFDAGRVILIDLTAKTVQAAQVKAALKELLPEGDPDWRDLKEAVQKLRAQDDKVRAFWPELR
jgi:hypothetical protein